MRTIIEVPFAAIFAILAAVLMEAKRRASLFYNEEQLYAASTPAPCRALPFDDRLAARAASAARPAPGLARQLRELLSSG
jgi:hypothetical protein